MAQSNSLIKEQQWLSLGEARALLHINEATLRQWADEGLVRSFRTPGGHRRFAREDIYSLIKNGQHTKGALPVTGEALDALVLSEIRKRLGKYHASDSSWRSGFNDAGLEEMREMGRQLVGVCLSSLSRRLSGDDTAAVRSLGQRYGAYAAQHDVPLEQVVEAFSFFRSAILDAVRTSLRRAGPAMRELTRCWSQITRLTDEALIALASSYQAHTKEVGTPS